MLKKFFESRVKTLWTLSFFLFVSVVSFGGERPNILLFIADDMTWRDCEPYGNSDVKTPSLQRLAEEGMCFDNMYTSTAMCAPTRQQLYTGLYPVRNGGYPNHSSVYEGVKSLVHYFRDIGYRVALAGKRHIAPEESFPFEYYDYFEGDQLETAAFVDVINRADESPFFLIYSSHDPHNPWDHGDPDKYDPDAVEIPPYLIDCPATRVQIIRYYAEITYIDWQFGQLLDYLDKKGLTDNTIVIFTSEQGSSFPFAKWTCYDNGLKTSFIVRWPGHIKSGTRNAAMAQYVDVVPTLLEAVSVRSEKINTGISDADGYTGFDGKSFFKVLLGKKKHRNYVYGVHTTRGIISGNEAYPIRSIRSRKYKYIINMNHEIPFSNNLIVNKENKEEMIYEDWVKYTDSLNDPELSRRVTLYRYRPEVEFFNIEKDPYELINIAGEEKFRRQMKKLNKKLKLWMEQQGDKGMETEMMAKERQVR